MASCELRYFSPALGMQTAANVILPEGKDHKGPYPVFYLLHGLSDDHTMWQRRTSIERYVQDLPLIVVMPNGGRGFYVDAREGFAFGRAISEDLVGLIDRTFPTRAERGGRAIGGLSMGGYGAVRLALGHPDLFASANSHSGALAFGHKPLAGDEPFNVEFRRVFGENPVGGPNDLFTLAEKFDKTRPPALRIDCGTEDFLIEDNRNFHSHLVAQNVRHDYEEFPGAHDWGYWDRHVQEAIAFHRKVLGV
jgi:S-formylglutathione hydrolase FrmB